VLGTELFGVGTRPLLRLAERLVAQHSGPASRMAAGQTPVGTSDLPRYGAPNFDSIVQGFGPDIDMVACNLAATAMLISQLLASLNRNSNGGAFKYACFKC